MKMSRILSRFTLTGLLLLPVFAFGCDEVPVGTNLWVRLTSPVTTFTARPGDHLSAILTESVECDDGVIFPLGSQLDGVVRGVRKVGWGIRHETARLEIAFTRVNPELGSSIQIDARVAEVENARERVKNGVIHGIRSTDTSQGRINSRLKYLPTWNPYSDTALLAFKLGFPVFPEPEIYYGPGTDLRLVLASPLASPPMAEDVAEIPGFVDEDIPALSHLVAVLPERSTTTANADADLVNLVFLGSQEQVEAAFRTAGWNSSDAVSRRSFMHNFYAFLDKSNYPQAPMRTLLVEGEPSDLNWQKSLNSYEKRDHIRMWQWKENWRDQPVWISASTHDMSATLSVRYHSFVHHIAPDLDAERAKVLRDLMIAGCVSQFDYVERPGVPSVTRNATGDVMHTDGAVAVVQLQDCQSSMLPVPDVPSTTQFRAGNRFFRFVRRQIITFRSDVLRANIIYGTYDLATMAVTSLRKHPNETSMVSERNIDVRKPRRKIVAATQPQEGTSAAAVPAE
jgi:hypothetical protein